MIILLSYHSEARCVLTWIYKWKVVHPHQLTDWQQLPMIKAKSPARKSCRSRLQGYNVAAACQFFGGHIGPVGKIPDPFLLTPHPIILGLYSDSRYQHSESQQGNSCSCAQMKYVTQIYSCSGGVWPISQFTALLMCILNVTLDLRITTVGAPLNQEM